MPDIIVASVVLPFKKNPIRSHERRDNDGTVTTTNGTCSLPFMTQIVVTYYPSHDDDRNTFEVITLI
jgi:hypothetical protein